MKWRKIMAVETEGLIVGFAFFEELSLKSYINQGVACLPFHLSHLLVRGMLKKADWPYTFVKIVTNCWYL